MRSAVEIVKTLFRGEKILVLDEPLRFSRHRVMRFGQFFAAPRRRRPICSSNIVSRSQDCRYDHRDAKPARQSKRYAIRPNESDQIERAMVGRTSLYSRVKPSPWRPCASGTQWRPRHATQAYALSNKGPRRRGSRRLARSTESRSRFSRARSLGLQALKGTVRQS